MAFFRRKSHGPIEVIAEPYVPDWAGRLSLVGSALDRAEQDVRDVAIVLDGGPADDGATVSLLSYRQSAFHAVWKSMMFRLEGDAVDLTDYATGFSAGAYRPTESHAESIGPWQARLRAIGMLIDRRHPALRSPSLLFLPGGVVVNGILMSAFGERGGSLISFELANDDIRATAAVFLSEAVSPVRSR
jgi:hypothetical protein